MTRRLDWKWIAIGVLVMVGLNSAAGLVLALVYSSKHIALTGWQVPLVCVINFLSFVIGGFIVGLKSAGRTLLEPGISAAVAVAIPLWLSGNFALVNMIAGGFVPFVAGLVGGWLGERRQATA